MKKIVNLVEFSKRNLLLIIVILLTTFATYYPKILYYNFSIDTERMIRDPEGSLTWWLELGRYGLVFLKHIAPFGTTIHVRFINIFTYTLLALSCILLVYTFQKILPKDNSSFVIPVCLYLSMPIWLEQTTFILQSVEVILAVNILIIALNLILSFFENSNYINLVTATALTIFSFSIYPSLIIGFITLSVGFSFFLFNEKLTNVIGYFKYVGICILICCVSYLCYLIGNKLTLKYFGLVASDYMSGGSLWGKISFPELLSQSFNSFKINFLTITPFLLIGVLLLFITICIAIATQKEIPAIIKLLTISGLFLCLFATFFYLGHLGPKRSLVPAYPFLIFIFSLYFCYYRSRWINKIMIIPMCILVCSQIFVTNYLGFIEKESFESQVKFTKMIKNDLTNRGITNYSIYKLAIIGSKTFDPSNGKGDIIGKSFFEWDAHGEVGVSYRAGDFLYTQGLTFQRVQPNEYLKAVGSSEDMSIYPSGNSIKVINDLIIIKLK